MQESSMSLTQLMLLGVAAVGGLAAGTCLGVRRVLRNGQARMALILGYSIVGLASGVLFLSAGIIFPVLDVSTLRGALLTGAGGGVGGVVLLIGLNLGSTLTLRWMGVRLMIVPDDSEHRGRGDD